MSLNYPIKFEPILKERIWGGEKLSKLLNKKNLGSKIGESWEVSDVQDDVSIVLNGSLKGKTLPQLIEEYEDELMGQKVYDNFGEKFPLLIKFIDAKEALSIQLHPNDVLAKERHNSFGKTEMWYIMEADKKGDLVVGFKKDSNKKEYLHHLEEKTLLDILNVDSVDKGDVYFIPTGTIHAIGAGVLLAEIQQTSDITYRVYDWDRLDANGNSRELHVEMALDAMDYKAKKRYNTNYEITLNKVSKVIHCQYFNTNIIALNGQINIDNSDKDSFVIYMCVAGKTRIKYEGGTEQLNLGETVLIPACLKSLTFVSDDNAELLEVYIKNDE